MRYVSATELEAKGTEVFENCRREVYDKFHQDMEKAMAQLLDMEDRAGHQGKPETQSQKGARMFSMSAEVSDGFERSEVQTVMANSIWVLACAAQVAADADVVTLGEAMRGKEWPQFEQAIINEINLLNAKD